MNLSFQNDELSIHRFFACQSLCPDFFTFLFLLMDRITLYLFQLHFCKHERLDLRILTWCISQFATTNRKKRWVQLLILASHLMRIRSDKASNRLMSSASAREKTSEREWWTPPFFYSVCYANYPQRTGLLKKNKIPIKLLTRLSRGSLWQRSARLWTMPLGTCLHVRAVAKSRVTGTTLEKHGISL